MSKYTKRENRPRQARQARKLRGQIIFHGLHCTKDSNGLLKVDNPQPYGGFDNRHFVSDFQGNRIPQNHAERRRNLWLAMPRAMRQRRGTWRRGL